MDTDHSTVEARQGDRRRANLRVLFYSLGVCAVIGAAAIVWL